MFENESNNNLYQLDNYNLISKSKYSSEHGGLLIYVHTDFECEPGLGSSTVDQVLKYTKYPKYIPSTSTGQVLIFLKRT